MIEHQSYPEPRPIDGIVMREPYTLPSVVNSIAIELDNGRVGIRINGAQVFYTLGCICETTDCLITINNEVGPTIDPLNLDMA